jgi:RND family efflux transporter MFP subunit
MVSKLRTFAALGLLAIPLAACTEGRSAEPAPTEERRAVVVETVRFTAREPERSFVGQIRPRVESDLGFRIAGKVSERLVQPGQSVSAGQLLMRLDPVDLRLSREQAEAEHRAAQVNLDQTIAQERRANELRRQGWTTDAVIEQRVAATAEARSRLDRASRALDIATNQLTYADLHADGEGVVTATLAEPGQVVTAGSPVVRLARSGEREAVVAIPEIMLERVRRGTATVSLWSDPGTRYPAQLRELAAAADPATRTFQARFSIDGPDEALAIGLTATVTVAEPASESVARLPVSAIFAQGQGAHVFVVDVDSGSLTLVPVTVAGYDGRDVLISGGVREGAQVVSLGVQKLDVAQRVRIVTLRS